jgi:hypothetical protein
MAVGRAVFMQQHLVLAGRQAGVEAGQDQRAARQQGDGPHQVGGGADRAGGAGGDHRAVAENQLCCIGLPAEPKVAQRAASPWPFLHQPFGPELEGDIEEGEDFLPVRIEILRGQGAEVLVRYVGRRQIVDEFAEAFREIEDFGRVGRGGEHRLALTRLCPGLDQRAQHQPALGLRHGWRQVGHIVRRQERLFLGCLAAKRADVGQQAMAPRAKCLGQRQPGAAGGEDDGHIAQPERAGARPVAQQRAVDDAVGKRRQERGMRGDGIEMPAQSPPRLGCNRRIGKKVGLLGESRRHAGRLAHLDHRVSAATAGDGQLDAQRRPVE